MKPLICPQCGAKIASYDPRIEYADCGYCGTKILIESQIKHEPSKPAERENPDVAKSLEPQPGTDELKLIGFGMLALVILIGIVLFALSSRPDRNVTRSPYEMPSTAGGGGKSAVEPRPVAVKQSEILEFGGTGTGDGLFTNASSIAVSRAGRIYVADETLRIQEFDANGKFIRVRQIPQSGKHYKKARGIQKIAVDKSERLYVLVAGTVQVWGPNTIELPDMNYHAAPDPIVDFALRADGGLLLLSVDGDTDTLIFLAANGRVMKRIQGFHTDTADAAISPQETALAAIRLAVDGAGNIFSIYAFGDLGSYQINYNNDEMRIFRFAPDGKYVDRFEQTMDSVGIETDAQGRVYISRSGEIAAFKPDGKPFGSSSGLSGIEAFTLDADGNIYVISKDRIIKREPIK